MWAITEKVKISEINLKKGGNPIFISKQTIKKKKHNPNFINLSK
jgi:hypothetical protein